MANQKFSGAVASQAYRWGYTCEFCKSPVEKTAHVSTQVGSMHKSTTWVTTTAAGAREIETQARMQLAGPVAQLQAKIDAGQFAPPKGEDGRCPHCKKYQHWAPAIRSQIASHSNPKKGRDDAIGMYMNAAQAMALGFALTWFVLRMIFRKSEAGLEAQVRELEGLEKNDPRFIAWGEVASGTRGMSVR